MFRNGDPFTPLNKGQEISSHLEPFPELSGVSHYNGYKLYIICRCYTICDIIYDAHMSTISDMNDTLSVSKHLLIKDYKNYLKNRMANKIYENTSLL